MIGHYTNCNASLRLTVRRLTVAFMINGRDLYNVYCNDMFAFTTGGADELASRLEGAQIENKTPSLPIELWHKILHGRTSPQQMASLATTCSTLRN